MGETDLHPMGMPRSGWQLEVDVRIGLRNLVVRNA